MEYIRNIVMTFEGITFLVIKIKKDRQISENIKLESNMSEKTKTMANRLRKIQEKNKKIIKEETKNLTKEYKK